MRGFCAQEVFENLKATPPRLPELLHDPSEQGGPPIRANLRQAFLRTENRELPQQVPHPRSIFVSNDAGKTRFGTLKTPASKWVGALTQQVGSAISPKGRSQDFPKDGGRRTLFETPKRAGGYPNPHKPAASFLRTENCLPTSCKYTIFLRHAIDYWRLSLNTVYSSKWGRRDLPEMAKPRLFLRTED
jgi:hypothetical protein